MLKAFVVQLHIPPGANGNREYEGDLQFFHHNFIEESVGDRFLINELQRNIGRLEIAKQTNTSNYEPVLLFT